MSRIARSKPTESGMSSTYAAGPTSARCSTRRRRGDCSSRAVAAGKARAGADRLRSRLDELQQAGAAAAAAARATAGAAARGRAGRAAPRTRRPRHRTRRRPGPAFKAGPLTLTFGGFAELAGIYRNRNEVADVSSNFNTGIPFPNSPQYHMSEFRGSARQSRLSLLTQGSQDGDAHGRSLSRNGFPELRSDGKFGGEQQLQPAHAAFLRDVPSQGRRLYLLAGQTFSLATLEKKGMMPRQEQIPLTIDGQYVAGLQLDAQSAVALREEFRRASWRWDCRWKARRRIVFNGPTRSWPTTVTSFLAAICSRPTVNYSIDVAPDVIVKVAWDPGFGHYEIYGLGRAFRDRAAQENHTMYGGGVGAGMILPLARQLDFQLSGLAGRGIGRYGSRAAAGRDRRARRRARGVSGLPGVDRG